MNNRCAGGGIQHVPEFCFAQLTLFVLRGIAVVWMNLDRESVVGVDELGKQRKTMAEDGDSPRAEQRLPVFLDERAQCLAAIWSILRDGADLCFPRLANRHIARRKLLPLVARQSASPPDCLM